MLLGLVRLFIVKILELPEEYHILHCMLRYFQNGNRIALLHLYCIFNIASYRIIKGIDCPLLETHLKFFEGIFKVHWSILKDLLKLSWNSHETLLKLLETLLNVESLTFMNTLHRQNDRPQLHFLGYFRSQKCVPFGKTLFLFG